MATKSTIIKRTPQLRRMLGDQPSFGALELTSPRYKLMACDLRDVAILADRLASAGLDPSRPTVFVAECVLAYLNPEASTALLVWAATFPEALLVDYDVLAPGDGFGKIMVDNFKRRGWPLLGATHFQSLADHDRRLAAAAFQASLTADMHAVCLRLVLADPDERVRVARLEIFDDPDEFRLMMEHYCLALAANGATAAAVLDATRTKLAAQLPVVPISHTGGASSTPS